MARLGAVAAVGTTSDLGVRNITLAGICDAERGMHEKFESGIGRLMNRLNLLKAQLARQHNLGETDVSQKFRFLGSAWKTEIFPR